MNEIPSGQPRQTKRDFLKLTLSGGLSALFGAILYPIFSYLRPPKQAEVEVSSVKVGKLNEVEKESGRIIKFGNKPVILIRTADDDLKAFSATCTHLDCTIQYRKDFGMIWCACHNGKYDLNGRNVSGPPPRPLDEYRVVVQGEEVFVSKKS
jgi:cytochrome b6-f complex iron-sulfur subunit